VTTSCTFATSIEDAWSNVSPDRQTGAVYVDNPVVTSSPTCAMASDFMAVRVGVFNRSKLQARDVSVQLVDAAGVTIGATPGFDLAAGGTATKTVAAGAAASGKVEIRLVDPKHAITGVLGNPGVYAVVKPTCSFKSEALPKH
jgi:hypothetical protein